MQKHSVRKFAKNHDFDLYGDMVKIRDAFSDTARDARGKAAAVLSDSVGKIKEETTNVHDLMTGYVAKKPIKSLGIALLSGYLVGAILTRRKKHKRS